MHTSVFCPPCTPFPVQFLKRTSLYSSFRSPSRPPTLCSLTSDPPSTPPPEMSSYLPSLKWPSFNVQTQNTSPDDDAPLSALPANERAALDALILLVEPLLSSSLSALPSCDPWNQLRDDAELRNHVLLRLLRFNGLSAERAACQLRSTLAWRAKSRIAEQPCGTMHGMAAGIPLSLLEPVGEGGARLFFAAAEQYVKRDADRAVQEVGVARMFEYMLYDVDGPRAKRCNVVVDFTGFSVKNVDLIGMKTSVTTYLDYYPDVFHKILLINYPKFLYGGTIRCSRACVRR